MAGLGSTDTATVAFLSGSVAFALAAGVLALLPGDLRPTGYGLLAEGMRWFWANR